MMHDKIQEAYEKMLVEKINSKELDKVESDMFKIIDYFEDNRSADDIKTEKLIDEIDAEWDKLWVKILSLSKRIK